MNVELQRYHDLLVLIASRCNSKYLAKFLFGLGSCTAQPQKMEVRIIANEHDTWNSEIADFNGWPFGRSEVYRENLRLGRAGLHEYFNMLLADFDVLPSGVDTMPDWIVYFCDDHFVKADGWDNELRRYIAGEKRSGDSEGKPFPLDPNDIWVLVPKFDNAGAMNHILSRGFVRALGNKVGRHGWIDSYINDLMRDLPDRVIRIDEEWFHDFTHDKPSPMSEAHQQGTSTDKGKLLPAYDTNVVRHRLRVDQELLTRAIEKEARS